MVNLASIDFLHLHHFCLYKLIIISHIMIILGVKLITVHHLMTIIKANFYISLVLKIEIIMYIIITADGREVTRLHT